MSKKILFVVSICSLSIILCILGSYMLGAMEESNKHLVLDKIEEENGIVEEVKKEPISNGMTIIIDPGHGGKDPGKVGINDALEKDINLDISLYLEEELLLLGYNVVMTRNTDEGLSAEGSDWGKVQDLEHRVSMINESEAVLAVSIHQNSYTSESIKGAQVFYYETSVTGKAAAALMQEEFKIMDPLNSREMKGNDSYYLLKRTLIPTIIVECGFLSNLEEATKLCDESYQKDIATTIRKGIESYVDFSK